MNCYESSICPASNLPQHIIYPSAAQIMCCKHLPDVLSPSISALLYNIHQKGSLTYLNICTMLHLTVACPKLQLNKQSKFPTSYWMLKSKKIYGPIVPPQTMVDMLYHFIWRALGKAFILHVFALSI